MLPTYAQYIDNPNSLVSYPNQACPQPIIISTGSSDDGLKSILPLLLLLLTDSGCGNGGCGGCGGCGRCGGCGGFGSGCGGGGCGGCGGF